MTTAPGSKHLLVRAALGQSVERPPVWAMRQAGRWDPEFQALRGELDFYEFTRSTELAARASLLPLRFGVDAIILFYDITSLAVAMGLNFQMLPERGPVPEKPIRTLDDAARLSPRPDRGSFEFIVQLLRMVKHELGGDLPVIVFAGAPFTLACYCLGSGKDVAAARQFAREQSAAWNKLLERIGSATIHFLKTLAREGADAFQLFDTWAGSLGGAEYQAWAMAWHQPIFESVKELPGFLFVRECPYVDWMVRSGAKVVSLGTTHDLASVREQFPFTVFQGNVDHEVLRGGKPEDVARATRRCLRHGGGKRHIVNLSHGVDKETPVANFQTYVQTALGGIPS